MGWLRWPRAGHGNGEAWDFRWVSHGGAEPRVTATAHMAACGVARRCGRALATAFSSHRAGRGEQSGERQFSASRLEEILPPVGFAGDVASQIVLSRAYFYEQKNVYTIKVAS
jgi:hypothetical protein